MEGKLLAPCVKDRNDPGLRAKELRVFAKCEQRFLHTLKLQIKKDFHIRFDQRAGVMRDRKDDVVVSDPFDQFRIAFQFPFLFQMCLAAGTGSAVAGDGVDLGKATVFTVADVIAEFTGLAVHNGRGRFPFFF